MFRATDYPLLVFAISLSALSLAAWIGSSLLHTWRQLDETLREDYGVVLAATLTLLGLIIGFTFSMATSRYDHRKILEEEEANAIGTEYARADLLPSADASRMRALLRDYTNERIAFYTSTDEEQLRRINVSIAKLQNELWAVVQGPAAAQPTPIMALVVKGMNDVLNSQGYTQAAWWNRIPSSAWDLMAGIAICCNLLLGYAARRRREIVLLLILPLVVSISFMLIADIDSPRGGFILVSPQNLMSLAGSLHGN
jgi:hypothetical protein